jgi:translocation and assembly module TamA
MLALLLAISPAQADVEIGITGVSDELANNIRAFLSLTRYADRDDITPDTMARLQRRIPLETRRALEPLGYYEPAVDFAVTPEGNDWKVSIAVVAGPEVLLSDVEVSVTGDGSNNPEMEKLLARRDLRPGSRLNHGTYEQVKSNLLRAATNQGYLDASYTLSELVIDPGQRRATVGLVLATGPQYHFGSITITQDAIRDSAMQRLLRMREGDPYSVDALLRTQYVLDDTQYFSTVEIETAERDQKSLLVPVTIRAKPNLRHRYAASVGYATDTRARGRLTWDDRRVNDRGHRMQIGLIGSSVVEEGSLHYAIPVMDIALEKLDFSALARNEELGDTFSKKYELGTGLTEVLGKWQRVVFLKLSQEITQLPLADGTLSSQKDTLLIPGISFSTLPVRPGLTTDLLHYSLYAELTGSPSTLGSDASYIRFRFQGERIFDLSDLWHLRVRGELGVSQVADFSELPASQRFFAGGDNSVRGFGLNELSPKDASGNNIGGRHLLVGTVELERQLPRNFGLAVFADGGNAFNHFGDPLEYSAGLGLRWHVSVASIGVDVAQALSESGRTPRLHLHISTLF